MELSRLSFGFTLKELRLFQWIPSYIVGLSPSKLFFSADQLPNANVLDWKPVNHLILCQSQEMIVCCLLLYMTYWGLQGRNLSPTLAFFSVSSQPVTFYNEISLVSGFLGRILGKGWAKQGNWGKARNISRESWKESSKSRGGGVNLETLWGVLVFWVSGHALGCVCIELPKGESSTYMPSCLVLLSALWVAGTKNNSSSCSYKIEYSVYGACLRSQIT